MFNTILCVVLLREPLFLSDIVGTILISIGSTLFLVSAKNDDDVKTSYEL
jgi:uncharacterized membrane protein